MEIRDITQSTSADKREILIVRVDRNPAAASLPDVVLTFHMHIYGEHVLLLPLSCVTEDTHESVTLTKEEHARIFPFVCQHIEEEAWAY
jgi:hypothetical protein